MSVSGFGQDRQDVPRWLRAIGVDSDSLWMQERLELSYCFQKPCDGMRNARLRRVPAFCQAMIIVISAMALSS